MINLFSILGKFEADDASLSLVYHYFGKLLTHFEKDRINLPKIQSRWDFIKKDEHGLAYILVPKFASSGHFFTNKQEIIGSMKGFASRRNPLTAQATMMQFFDYIREVSALTGPNKDLVDGMSASDYWNVFGKIKFPLVYECAKSINAMVCSSAASERAWSIHGFVHTPLRNKLANEKVNKLAFLYINSGLLDDTDIRDYVNSNGTLLRDDDYEFLMN